MSSDPGHTTQLHDWLRELQQGKADARNKIVEHTCERLRSLASRMLRSYPKLRRWSETDDILQQSMMRLHRSLADICPENARQFYGLAAMQIRRELIDLSRHYFGSLGLGSKHETDRPGENHHVDRVQAPEGEPGSLEDWTKFHEAIGRLPDNEREVFSLLWYDGMTQEDAANVLSVSLKTVKRRWQSARISLHEVLSKEST